MKSLSGTVKHFLFTIDDGYDDDETLCIEDTEDTESLVLDLGEWDALKTGIDKMITNWKTLN